MEPGTYTARKGQPFAQKPVQPKSPREREPWRRKLTGVRAFLRVEAQISGSLQLKLTMV